MSAGVEVLDNDKSENKGQKRSQEDAEDSINKKLNSSSNNDEKPVKRVKLKNYALLMSYCGKEYYGMQLQRSDEFHTIEDLLLKSMEKNGLLESAAGKNFPQNLRFQRASRTDKGVSAVRQVVSINIPEDAENIPKLINQYLPDDIRIFKAIRVTKSFSSKNWCNSRSYSYLCPTYAFAKPELENEEYRLPKDHLKEINDILCLYVGTHKFHNFTSQKSFNDPSSQRYIVSFEAGEPFMRNDCEWLRITVVGHSFMIHQIRKMIGLTMAISKGFATKDVIQESWGGDKVDIPKAPGLGLVLEEPYFVNYNKKYGGDGVHQSIGWSDVEDELQIFREKYIDSTIIETECKEKSMKSWLSTLPLHVYTSSYDEECKKKKEALNIAGSSIDDKNNKTVETVVNCEKQASAPS